MNRLELINQYENDLKFYYELLSKLKYDHAKNTVKYHIRKTKKALKELIQ